MTVLAIQGHDLQAIALACLTVLIAFFAIRWYTDPVSADSPAAINHIH